MSRFWKQIKKSWKKILGIYFVLKGFVFTFLTYRGITGLAVSETFEIPINFWLGFAFFVIGVGILMVDRRESGLEQKIRVNSNPEIIWTKKFKKSIGRDRGMGRKIDSAIQKITSGIGKSERLKHQEGYSVRVTKGARLIYTFDGKGNIKLLRYVSAHNY